MQEDGKRIEPPCGEISHAPQCVEASLAQLTFATLMAAGRGPPKHPETGRTTTPAPLSGHASAIPRRLERRLRPCIQIGGEPVQAVGGHLKVQLNPAFRFVCFVCLVE